MIRTVLHCALVTGLLAGSASAAVTKVLDFDPNAPGAWNQAANAGNGELTDTVGGKKLVANGYPTYAAPTFVAATPTTRAYIGMFDYSFLDSATKTSGNILNVAGKATGYTLEAYVKYLPGFTTGGNAGLGADVFPNYDTDSVNAGGNTFLNYSSVYSFNSSTEVANSGETGFTRTVTNINGAIAAYVPANQWMHLVKTNVISGVTSTTNWYINGVLIATASTNAALATDLDHYVDYAAPSRSLYPENYGQFGTSNGLRYFKNLDYGLFRVYQGGMTGAEVLAEFNLITAVAPIPEPGSIGAILLVGGMVGFARRRRGNR